MTEQSKWIWLNQEAQADTYGEFVTDFTYREGEVCLYISADSNYVVSVNGAFVCSEQYPDFPHYKVYDKIDITSFCQEGTNRLYILVWYYGVKGTSTYYRGNAGLRFEVYQKGKLCAWSDENVRSRLCRNYQNGLRKQITTQLGLSFCYDATVRMDDSEFQKSRVVVQNLAMHERPIEKMLLKERVDAICIKQDENYFLYDIGCEEVGYLTLKVRSEKKQKLTICFGEHIVDGGVRRKIGNRDFSVEVVVGVGETEYTNYFRRLGLRYLEVWAEEAIEVEYASVIPCVYPVHKVERKFDNPLHQKIYDVAVRTLELCMHDHYEDCPWREQALYVMDGRNQMLCGYYAFGEYNFPRANLYLISQDNREDGLLSICTPINMNLTIPSFSLHYFIAVYEYSLHSKDLTLAKEILPKLQAIMDVFLNRMKEGLVPSFQDKYHWNFYEWTDDLANDLGVVEEPKFEAALNCLLSIALQKLQKICNLVDVNAEYGARAEELNKQIHKTFYREETGLFVNRQGEERYSELVNALAVLCGAATETETKKICEVLTANHDITKCSLSMMCFKYDALIQTDRERYRLYVIEDMEKKYGRMLEAGATSFWETEEGESAFDHAGSLCHGWSAMAVYYLCMLI